MARVPCAPVPDTGRQGTIEVLASMRYCFLGMPNLEIPPRLSMFGPQSRAVQVSLLPPSSRRSVPAWRIKRVARFSRQQGCADRCYTRSKRNASRQSLSNPRIRVRLHHSSSDSPVPHPAAVMAALSPRPRVPASKICGFPALGPDSRHVLRLPSRSHLPHLSGTRAIIEAAGGRCHWLHPRPLLCFTADT